MAFTPDTRARNKDDSTNADAEEMPSRKLSNLGKLPVVYNRERECVGSENGRQRRSDDGFEGDDKEDQVSTPSWPVLHGQYCLEQELNVQEDRWDRRMAEERECIVLMDRI
jgi:hypothetical protein